MSMIKIRYNILQTSQIQEIIHKINSEEIFYEDLPTDQKHNRHIIIAAIKKDMSNIDLIPAYFFDDYDIMLELVKHDGSLLWYASKDLIQNHNIVLSAVQQDGMALEIVYDCETVYEDEELYVNEYDSDGPYWVHEERQIIDDSRQILVDNEEIVSIAVAQNPFAYKFISTRLKQNKKIAMIALKQNGLLLELMVFPLRNDIELMVEAVLNNRKALVLIPSKLKSIFKNIIKNALQGNVEYFYEKIIDGSIVPYTQLMLKLLPPNKYKELKDWLKINISKNESLFEILFYKCKKNKCQTQIGYFDTIRDTIFSYLPPLTKDIVLIYKIVL